MNMLRYLVLVGTAFAAATSACAGSTSQDWTGLYGGASIGVGDSTVVALPPFDPAVISLTGNSQSGSAPTFGAQIGYDRQVGQFVVGALAEINYLHVDTSGGFVEDGDTDNSFETHMDLLGSVRAKIGAGSDKVLVYGTGGIAFTNARISNWNYEGDPLQEFPFSSPGYVFGGGIQIRVNEKWTAFGDFSHYVFTTSNSIQEFSDEHFGSELGGNNSLGINLLKIGLNYKL